MTQSESRNQNQSASAEKVDVPVRHKLRRATDYSRLLSAAAGSAPAQTRVADTPNSEQVAAAVDSMGRLQESYNEIGERLAVMRRNLETYLPKDGEIAGSNYRAVGSTEVERRLLGSQKITSLLIYLLSEVEEKQASHGGLFDLILSLDEDLLNQHFVPLLDAVFEQAGLSDKASKLYMESPQRLVAVEPLSKAG